MRIGIKMIRRLSREESGYSLVEVIVSIFILAAAILPMVGMFDMGLNAATRGSNYDKARALADTNLEKVRAIPYSTAKSTYRPVNDPPADGSRSLNCSQGVFTCSVVTTYVDDSFNNDVPATMMKVVVTVTWGSNNSFTVTGLKAS